MDLNNHGNIESNVVTLLYNNTPISVAMVSEFGDIIDQSRFTINIEFSDRVNGLEENDFDIENGSIVGLTGSGANYKLFLETNPNGERVITATMAEGAVIDFIGIKSPMSQCRVLFDQTNPNVHISSEIIGPTFSEIIPVTIQFDDPAYEFIVDPIGCLTFDNICFTLEDINIKGGYITNFKGGFGYYTMSVNAEHRYVELSIDANVTLNSTGLPNLKSNLFQMEYVHGNVLLESSDNSYPIEPIRHWIESHKLLNIVLNKLTPSVNVSIIDSSGKIMYENAINTTHWIKDLNGLKSGLYILIIRINKKRYVSKFVL